MDLNSLKDLKRLEEQIFQYKPNIKSIEKRKRVSERLRSQLLQSKAVVRIQRLDSECESLMVSLKQRLMVLQNIFKPNDIEVDFAEKQQLQNQDEFMLNLACESSEDGSLYKIRKENDVEKHVNITKIGKVKTTETQESEPLESELPLALRKKPRERRLSCKSYSSTSTSHSKANRKILHNSKDVVELEEVNTAPTLHIKIPSLHRGNVHYIVLDSLDFARKVFDYRANEVRQQQQKSISQKCKILKTHKKQLKCSSAPVLQHYTENEDELEFSQLIQDVMAETNDETLQATCALESINKNLFGNYDLVGNDAYVNYSRSSKEFSYSQNSDLVDTVCSTSERCKVNKKSRKNTKRPNKQHKNEPPKKRGRKPRMSNNDADQPQPPTKSNLAQYVEFFSNDCELLPGSSTPAASSTRSQQLVSSTTHNFEVVDQFPQQIDQEPSQQPITYYIDGDWANGGPCQLVTTHGVTVDGRQLSQDDNTSFQNFINYNDNSVQLGNNVVEKVLECNNSIPISMTRSTVNFGSQIKSPHDNGAHQIHHQSIVENSWPIINIQIPPLPNNVTSSNYPPPAHMHKEVVDLSIKSTTNLNVNCNEAYNLNKKSNNMETLRFSDDDECLPLDLSANGSYAGEKPSENNSVTINTQDEDFIRRLLEQQDFDYADEAKIGNKRETLAYEHDNSKSFKVALNMPLLEFDSTDFEHLVENAATTSNNLTDNPKNNEDSSYVSMTAGNSSIENTLQYPDQSTTEIFSNLLDICPDNNFLNNLNNAFALSDDLNDSAFDECRVENSTMCDVENLSIHNNQLEEREKEIYKATSKNSSESFSIEQQSSTPLDTHLKNSNITEDISLSLRISNDKNSNEMKHSETINVKSSEVVICSEISNAQEFSTKHKAPTDDLNLKSGSHTNNKTLNDPLKKNGENVTIFTVSELSIKSTEKDIDYQESNSIENTRAGFSTNDNKELNDTKLCVERDESFEPSQKYSNVKSKENIVFSVAKITLSEDDIHLYNTDSDISSGKSFDLSEIIPMDNDKNIKRTHNPSFQRVSVKEGKESDKLELNNCGDEVEIFPKIVDKNVGDELIDIPKELHCPKEDNESGCNDISKNSKTDCENLTLLELESKLEDALDFGEDFDDALSLTTSSFDSPNDERFEDSIVDIHSTTTPLNTSQDLQRHDTIPNPTQIKNCKHFKIPKISNATGSSLITAPNEPEETNSTPTSSLTAMSANMEKITIKLKNNLVQLNPDNYKGANLERSESVVSNCEPVKRNVNSVELLISTHLVTEKTTVENVIFKIFGISCLPYLVDKCIVTTHCQLSHKFNDDEKVYRILSNMDKIYVNLAYQAMCHHLKLFKLYFKIFCNYYTNKNDRIKLLNMANDCERYSEHAEFIILIYEGLVSCGLSRVNACRFILKRVGENRIETPIVEALVAIIMKSDWTMFTDFIEKYTNDMYQFNFRICILEQMAPAVLNSKGSHLKQVFGKCVQTLHRDDTSLLLNSPILIQCVALLTTNT